MIDFKDFEYEKIDEIEDEFTYHPPKEGQPERYETIRECAKYIRYLIEYSCPESKEKKYAAKKLREAVFWANAAIAINE